MVDPLLHRALWPRDDFDGRPSTFPTPTLDAEGSFPNFLCRLPSTSLHRICLSRTPHLHVMLLCFGGSPLLHSCSTRVRKLDQTNFIMTLHGISLYLSLYFHEAVLHIRPKACENTVLPGAALGGVDQKKHMNVVAIGKNIVHGPDCSQQSLQTAKTCVPQSVCCES